MKIGVCGGIGSGKSEVLKILEGFGAEVVFADKVAHVLYEPRRPLWEKIVNTFGNSILAEDGRIDRKKLADIVFSERSKLRLLNSLVHKEVKREVLKKLSQPGDVVVEAALLIEAKWFKIVDRVWVVTAKREIIVDRLKKTRKMSEYEITKRMRNQLDTETMCRYADSVIPNNGSIDELKRLLKDLWKKTKEEIECGKIEIS